MMHHDDRCFDCLLSRVSLETSLARADPDKSAKVYNHAVKLLSFLQSTPYSHTVVASLLHRSVYNQLNTSDPFTELKDQSTRDAAAVIDIVSHDLRDFRDLVCAAVIGNIFDYGVKGHQIQDDFLQFFRKEYTAGLYRDDTAEILHRCRRVVYFTDNCGEILFDRLLIRYLKDRGSYITLVVRDAPILNDATVTDAYSIGLDRLVDELYTTSSGSELGIRFDLLSTRVRSALDTCTVIIAKGMANYESLREEEGLPPIAYMLAAKCDPIAEELHVPRGSKLALLRC